MKPPDVADELGPIYGELMRCVDRLNALYGPRAGIAARLVRRAKQTAHSAALQVLDAGTFCGLSGRGR